ncbi:hypothetical protein EJB05_57555, partial [Eragrostis curvula]
MEHLEQFRRSTHVQLQDGKSISFWLDLWDGNPTLSTDYPALFSHTLRPNMSVNAVLTDGNLELNLALRSRLTSAAQAELESLTLRLNQTALTDDPVRRMLRSSCLLRTRLGALQDLRPH